MHQPQTGPALVYSPMARAFHWLTVAFVAVMLPLGVYMVERGEATKFDATTNTLYSLHKLLGFTLLAIVIARLIYRFRQGAPADEPTLEPWQKLASHATHWGLYALLLAVPLGGWFGVQLYGARDVFGLFNLPGIVGENQEAAARVFFLHKLGAITLFLLVGAHVGAALYHRLIRKDGVLARMWPRT